MEGASVEATSEVGVGEGVGASVEGSMKTRSLTSSNVNLLASRGSSPTVQHTFSS